ncbi:MAG: hypothetical protein FVQ82_11940 [Planctomycetes bacterium]|nr:hypothetical protein [Planctomycetota bacterium]
MFKRCKKGLFLIACLSVAGTFFFGKDLVSYVKTSGKWARTVIKDSVPVEFELRRARDLLQEIIPEMHANIGLIAKEEVEVAALKNEVSEGEKSVNDQWSRVAQLRNYLKTSDKVFSFHGKQFSRQQVKDDLSWRFDRFKESELVLASKIKLLATRQSVLQSSMDMLEKTKGRKRLLASKIENLEIQHRLLKASAIESGIHVDNSKLAKTEKLINDVKKRLKVAERVLAHENLFVQTIPFDEVTETELTGQIDEYFSAKAAQNAVAEAN